MPPLSQPWLYAAACAEHRTCTRVKIGRTGDIAKRIEALTNSSTCVVELLAFARIGEHEWWVLHGLNQHRHHGEWFDGPVLSEIRALGASTIEPSDAFAEWALGYAKKAIDGARPSLLTFREVVAQRRRDRKLGLIAYVKFGGGA